MALLQPHLTIHLGDVYYAGTETEEQQLLVNLWPSGSMGALALNSNHEMYSGGTPYFNVALGVLSSRYSAVAASSRWRTATGSSSVWTLRITGMKTSFTRMDRFIRAPGRKFNWIS